MAPVKQTSQEVNNVPFVLPMKQGEGTIIHRGCWVKCDDGDSAELKGIKCLQLVSNVNNLPGE